MEKRHSNKIKEPVAFGDRSMGGFYELRDYVDYHDTPSPFDGGLTEAQRKRDPNAPDACVWSMEWKNPWPLDKIEDITFVGAGTEATVALFGVTTVR